LATLKTALPAARNAKDQRSRRDVLPNGDTQPASGTRSGFALAAPGRARAGRGGE